MVTMKPLQWLGGVMAAVVLLTACGTGPGPGKTASSTGVDGSQTAYWQQRLAGKKLTRIGRYGSTGGGYSYRYDTFLCGNGSYMEQGESSVSVDVGGASGHSGGQKQAQGTWQVVEMDGMPKLEVRSGTGEVIRTSLSEQDGKTFIEGERVYVTPQDLCP